MKLIDVILRFVADNPVKFIIICICLMTVPTLIQLLIKLK